MKLGTSAKRYLSKKTRETLLFMKMKVNEIFSSIDGEGITTGALATFIRLTGCNLRCSYCDTAYAFNEGNEMDIDDIIKKCHKLGNRRVTLTGGEPLFQENSMILLKKLIDEGFHVNLETNGSISVPSDITQGLTITMDWKTPTSIMHGHMKDENLCRLKESDCLKIVCSEIDFHYVKNLLMKYRPKCYVYLSPIFGKCDARNLVSFLKELHNDGLDTEKYRVQIQLHKVIWDPQKRGV